jgi:hypothetical protein
MNTQVTDMWRPELSLQLCRHFSLQKNSSRLALADKCFLFLFIYLFIYLFWSWEI